MTKDIYKKKTDKGEFYFYKKPSRKVKSEDILKNNSLKVKRIDGIKFNPILGKWKNSHDLSVNYIICSTKN